jgi:hypothetical protein
VKEFNDSLEYVDEYYADKRYSPIFITEIWYLVHP